jgi:hypothetical protein
MKLVVDMLVSQEPLQNQVAKLNEMSGNVDNLITLIT